MSLGKIPVYKSPDEKLIGHHAAFEKVVRMQDSLAVGKRLGLSFPDGFTGGGQGLNGHGSCRKEKSSAFPGLAAGKIILRQRPVFGVIRSRETAPAAEAGRRDKPM